MPTKNDNNRGTAVNFSPRTSGVKPLIPLLLLLSSAFAGTATGREGAEPGSGWIGGWLTYWQFEAGLASVRHSATTYQDVYFFIGQLSPGGDPQIAASRHDFHTTVQQLRREGKRTWLTVVNDVVAAPHKPILKDPLAISRMLATPQRRQQHIDQLVALARQYGFHGIDIDYENLKQHDRNRFSLFIEALAQALQQHGMELAVTVQPKTGATRRNGAGANDWQRLCRVADRLQIMLYNEHSGKTGPGPIATTAWIARVLDYAESRCPIDKVVPALKVVGATWDEKGVRGTTHTAARTLASQHNATIERTGDLVPHFNLPLGTTYYEDARSIGHKLTMLTDRGYNRTVIWRLGSYDPQIDQQLRKFRADSPQLEHY